MENDLVKRIRESTGGFDAPGTDTRGLMDEAADEIEHLKKCLNNRDDFIGSKDLWSEFVASLSVTADKEQG